MRNNLTHSLKTYSELESVIANRLTTDLGIEIEDVIISKYDAYEPSAEMLKVLVNFTDHYHRCEDTMSLEVIRATQRALRGVGSLGIPHVVPLTTEIAA